MTVSHAAPGAILMTAIWRSFGRHSKHLTWRGNRLPDHCDALIRRVTGW